MPQGRAIFQEHVLLPTTVDGAIWPYSRPDQKPAHFHGQIEFVLVLRGRAMERIGNQTYAVHAGQLIWHLPGISHEMVEASNDLDLRVVHVEPDVAAALGPRRDAHSFEWATDVGLLAAGRPVVELRRSDLDRLREECEATSVDVQRGTKPALRLRRAFDSAVLATRSHYDYRRANSLVELACCLLLDNPELDRGAVCRLLDVSEGYLSRRFTAELGVSFLEQRSRLRIVRFVTHVTREGSNLLDAALRAGFGSYSQLHRVFVKEVGMNPRRYLSREMRNQRGAICGGLANSAAGVQLCPGA